MFRLTKKAFLLSTEENFAVRQQEIASFNHCCEDPTELRKRSPRLVTRW